MTHFPSPENRLFYIGSKAQGNQVIRFMACGAGIFWTRDSTYFRIRPPSWIWQLWRIGARKYFANFICYLTFRYKIIPALQAVGFKIQSPRHLCQPDFMSNAWDESIKITRPLLLEKKSEKKANRNKYRICRFLYFLNPLA